MGPGGHPEAHTNNMHSCRGHTSGTQRGRSTPDWGCGISMATLEWQSWRAHPPGAAARGSGKTPVCVQAAAHSSPTSWPPHPSRRTQVPMDLVQPSITIPPLSVSDGPVPSCAATPVHTASSNPHQAQGSLPVRLAPGANLGPKSGLLATAKLRLSQAATRTSCRHKPPRAPNCPGSW
ncbi:hypothetical protein EI555_007839, partial [Monodon monoceros]